MSLLTALFITLTTWLYNYHQPSTVITDPLLNYRITIFSEKISSDYHLSFSDIFTIRPSDLTLEDTIPVNNTYNKMYNIK